MLEVGLLQYLSQQSDLVAEVGGRVYFTQGPPGNAVYPYVSFRVISSSHPMTLEGRESGRKLIQFDVFSQTLTDGKEVLLALRNALVGFVGMLPEDTARVLCVTRGNEIDNFDNDQKLYHSLAEYEFEYVED